jgi:hypothetical protein
MKSQILLFASALLIFSSCAKDESKNVNQDTIFAIYELNYSALEDITKARATFRFGGAGGTLLELSDPAKVTFNGEELLYNSVTGIHKKDFAGFISSGTYIYTDLDDNTYTNSTPEINTIDFPDITTISSAEAYTFEWIGDPVQEGETVTLTINGTQQENLEVFTTSTVGATQLILSFHKLLDLGLGEATATLQRAYNVWSVDEGTSEGGRMSIWYTTNRIIEIVE